MATETVKLNKDGSVAKKRGSSGPREAKPVYAIVTLHGPDGAEININGQSGMRLTIRATKDNAELVGILTSGTAANAAVVPLQMSQAPRANPGDATPAA